MVKKTYLVPLMVVVLILTVSCGLIEPTEELEGNYYPLGFGYEWTYDQLEGSGHTRSIIEQTEINGKIYYRDENDYSDHLRCENNKLYQLHDGKEYLIIDFNKPVGFEWDHPFFIRNNKILSKNASYDSLENCIVISSESAIDYSEMTYAPGIGLVSTHAEGRGDIIIICGDSRLKSATINGETINFDEQ